MFKRGKKSKFVSASISPDEVFLDSKNIPNFDSHQFEGRMEKPISFHVFVFLGAFFLMTGLFLIGRIGQLQIVSGDGFAARAENNRLNVVPLLAERGLIYDRNEEVLAWNDPDSRRYKKLDGLGHIVGYLGCPVEEDYDRNQFASYKNVIGKDGVEKSYENILAGEPGFKIVETDSRNEIKSEIIQKHSELGEPVYLSIDSRLQDSFYNIITNLSVDKGFQGGAGVIMDVHTGEILSMVNYPEYNSQILTNGEQDELIQGYINDPQKPFLNRAISGLYAPGSVVKPFMALAALNEKIIDPEREIFSSGSISIPNPYNENEKSVFADWKAHGWVDMKRALAVSSNVYFYSIGGGYENVNGLGIRRIKDYMDFFGFGSKTGIDLSGESEGLVPSQESKKENSNDPVWRIGDTYNVSIGQGGFLVTPLQMAVATAFLANGGYLITPSIILKNEVGQSERVGISEKNFNIVKEGMRMAVTEGTANALNWFPVNFAAKTGTAELGSGKYVNSWLISFWPYENPRYAASIVMEKGRSTNLIGALFAMKQLVDWMLIHTPEYLKGVDDFN